MMRVDLHPRIPTSITSLGGKTLSGALPLLARQWRGIEEESSPMNLVPRLAKLSRTVKLVNLSHPEEGSLNYNNVKIF